MKTIGVTKHAVDRYVERTNTKENRHKELIKRIIQHWNDAKPVELKPQHRLIYILRHGSVDKEVEYRLSGGNKIQIIFVVVDNSLVTVRPYREKVWREIL